MTENQKLREALSELIKAYNRAGPELSRAERAVDRMRLIAAHEALALPTAAPVGELPDPVMRVDMNDDGTWGELQQSYWGSNLPTLKVGDPLFTANQMRAQADQVAALAVAKEREECAKVCEELDRVIYDDPGSSFADAIRARGEA